jgi:hypothetical protein
MNPEWVELAQSERSHEIDIALRPPVVAQIMLPAKLWDVIRATAGWFEVRT